MTPADVAQAIANMAQVLRDTYGLTESTSPTTDAQLKALAWEVQRAASENSTPGVGACRYIDSAGVPHCCNLTAAQCSQIPGSTFGGAGTFCSPSENV
jgi:hypothetical protein